MDEIVDFINTRVRIRTYTNDEYSGVLLGIDQYLNAIIQDTKLNNTNIQKPMFIKGSNILFINKA
ncbi:hypothetical protein NEOKW01_0003 [Nematocida sp. AWRm80]|nr:hypothetical protein NEOKW01_0003 [Nematocida sp. AWRm80]